MNADMYSMQSDSLNFVIQSAGRAPTTCPRCDEFYAFGVVISSSSLGGLPFRKYDKRCSINVEDWIHRGCTFLSAC